MQSKATNSSLLSAYHFALKHSMTYAQTITHHIFQGACSALSFCRMATRCKCRQDMDARKRRPRKIPLSTFARRAATWFREVNGLQEEECERCSVSGSGEDGAPCRLKSVKSTPEDSCIRISRLGAREAGDYRDAMAVYRPFCTTTYYI